MQLLSPHVKYPALSVEHAWIVKRTYVYAAVSESNTACQLACYT